MAENIRSLMQIEISRIVQGAQKIREVQEDDSLVELAESIAARGLLQPIGVAPMAEGTFQLLFGARRLAACVRLGRSRILARIMPAGSDEVRAVAVVENLVRKQLTLPEECAAIALMHFDENKSVEQIAAAVHKSRSWVLNRLMVPSLPDFLREPLLDGSIGIGHIEVLGTVPEESAQRYLVACAIQQRLTIGQLKSLAQIYIDSPSVSNAGQLPQAGASSAPAAGAPEFRCDACGDVGPIEHFVFARVCKDGCRSQPAGSGSDKESGRSDGLEDSGGHEDGRKNSGGD